MHRTAALAPTLALVLGWAGCVGQLGGEPPLPGAGGRGDGDADADRNGDGDADADADGDGDSDADGDADSDVDADGDVDADADGDGDGDGDGDPPVEPCAPIGGVEYGSLGIEGAPSDRPAAEHGDINLFLRGWDAVGEHRGLVDVDGPTDLGAPLLSSLFADDRVPDFSNVYAVHQWDWGSNAPGGAISEPSVTLAGMQTTPGEQVEAPRSGYDIGNGATALVLYATERTLTLKYTREDNVVWGYTVHVVGVCTEPSLLALYERLDREGRGNLPALRGDQPMGRAIGTEIQVSIRDTGSFMDPRVRKDWW